LSWSIYVYTNLFSNIAKIFYNVLLLCDSVTVTSVTQVVTYIILFVTLWLSCVILHYITLVKFKEKNKKTKLKKEIITPEK